VACQPVDKVPLYDRSSRHEAAGRAHVTDAMLRRLNSPSQERDDPPSIS
jgi:hypothetical protein